jgi:hypothetical protein
MQRGGTQSFKIWVPGPNFNFFPVKGILGVPQKMIFEARGGCKGVAPWQALPRVRLGTRPRIQPHQNGNLLNWWHHWLMIRHSRICGDYKMLNQQISLDRDPIARLDELMDKLRGGKHFSKLDLADAYLQLELEESAKEVCVINTTSGLFRYISAISNIRSSLPRVRLGTRPRIQPHLVWINFG